MLIQNMEYYLTTHLEALPFRTIFELCSDDVKLEGKEKGKGKGKGKNAGKGNGKGKAKPRPGHAGGAPIGALATTAGLTQAPSAAGLTQALGGLALAA